MSYREDLAKQVLDFYLKGYKHFDGYRPGWLGGLEIDRFYPDLGVGIEFQGSQHFRPVPGMHRDEEAFRRQVANDSQKREIMYRSGFTLYAIDMLDLDEYRLSGLVNKIVSDGKKYAALKGNQQVLMQLNTVRTEFTLPDYLKQQVNRASYEKNKGYFVQGKAARQSDWRHSWWGKILKSFFAPPPPKRGRRY